MACSWLLWSLSAAARFSLGGPQVQADEDALGVAHVADEPAQRQRQFLDQGRRGDDLLALGQHGLLVDVDHLQVVAALQVLLADLADVRIACVERGVMPAT